VSAGYYFEPATQQELEEAADFYDLESPGLGMRFGDAVKDVIENLLEFSESCPVRLGETRKLVLARYPYSILYRIDGGRVVVSAVAHQSRRPGYLGDRI
jgi:plasmid stabilization system protein ParE